MQQGQGIFHERFGLILFLVVVLVSVGQITNTIYVPAITLIAQGLSIKTENVESLIGAYLLMYGLSQFIYGPLSDLYGRRPVVLLGLLIFTIGCTMAVFSNNFTHLFWGCVVQGLGTGVCGVMARTVMRDCYTDHKLQKANSHTSTALILAPLIAPMIGGFLSTNFGWRAIFLFLLVFGGFILAVEYYLFPETNLYIKKEYRSIKRIIKAYKTVFTHRVFWGYLLCLTFTFAGIAVFEASAGLLFTDILGFDTKYISWLFIIPIPGYLLGSYFAASLGEFLTLTRIMLIAIITFCFGAIILCIFAFANILNIYVILAPITFCFFGAGLLFPTATTGALNSLGEYAGTAGAVLGAFQNMGAALLTLGFALIPQTTQKPLSVLLILLSIALITTFIWVMKHLDN